jgi:putative two-component system response regulator
MNNAVLVVDDSPQSLHTVDEILAQEFATVLASDGPSALALLAQGFIPGLILLDVVMPDMDGYQICQQLKSNPNTANIPVIFFSANDRAADVVHGLALGAIDFMSKPLVPSILLARVRNHLQLSESRELLADHNRHLEHLVADRTRALADRTADVLRAQDLAIVALGTVAETRDNETGNHIFRTQSFVKLLVEQLSATAYYERHRNGHDWTRFWRSAPLHDIGKVGIPDRILLKPAKLTREEFAVMKRHTELGKHALETAEWRTHICQSYLSVAIEIAHCHHERWNGSGYPQGIAGNAIPVSARLMAVADVYDALVSKRIYKLPMTHSDAIEEMRSGRGSHFDPDILDCFLDLADEFQLIAEKFGDM